MKIDLEFITEEEMVKFKRENKAENLEIPIPKISLKKILLIIIVAGFLFNQVLMWRMNSSNFLSKLFNINITITKK